MLEEILELSRTNQKILRSPEILFPQEYVEFIFKERTNRDLSERERDILEELRHYMMELQHRIANMREMIEFYQSEKKTIDDDFSNSFLRLFDFFQRIQMLIEQTNRIIRRKLL